MQRIVVLMMLALSLIGLSACDKPDPEAADVFRVEDFGAVGDGVHDDSKALRAAVLKAIRNGGGTVVFQPKTYRMEETRDYWFHFMFMDVHDVTLEGNGAKLVSTPTNLFFTIGRSRNITIRNLTLDYSPLPFSQGIITAVDPAGGTMVFTPSEGYPEDLSEYHFFQAPVAEHFNGWTHVMVMNPDFQSRKATTGSNHYYISKVEKVGDRSFKITVIDRYRDQMKGIEPGDGLVLGTGFRFDRPFEEVKASRFPCIEKQSCIAIRQSENIVLDGVRLYAAPGRWIGMLDNYGKITVKNCFFGPEPGTDRAVSSIRDGIHAKNNRKAVIIENNHFQATMDDLLNCVQMEELVTQVKTPTTLELRNLAQTYFTMDTGNELIFKRPGTGEFLGTAKVKSILSKGERTYWVELDRPVAGLTPVPFKDKESKQACTAMNYSRVSSGFRICNNKFIPLLRRALATTWCDGEISGNEFDCRGGGMLCLTNSQNDHEGPFIRNVVVRNNVIRNSTLSSIALGNIWAGGNPQQFDCQVSILDNQVIGQRPGAPGIHIFNVKGVRMSGNTISMSDPSAEPVVIRNSQVDQR